MKLRFSVLFLLATICFVEIYAQENDLIPPSLKSGEKVEDIVAVVGKEIILESDIDDEFKYLKSQGAVDNKCKFIEDRLLSALVLEKAKRDTLMKITDDKVAPQVEAHYNRILQSVGSEQMLLRTQNRSISEIKEDIREVLKNRAYADQQMKKISGDVRVSPLEVKDFYERNKDLLPEIPEEFELAHIVFVSNVSEATKKQMVADLNEIRSEVLEKKADFSIKAILRSEDPGSASKGGLINLRRGQMVKPFEAAAYSLQEGEISEPFETPYGYHIVKLEKRKGLELQVRHILLRFNPTDQELKRTQEKAIDVYNQVSQGKITFEKAAATYSSDKTAAGMMINPETMENKFELEQIPANIYEKVSQLAEGEISEPFESQYKNQKAYQIVKVVRKIAPHPVSYQTDYNRLSRFAKEEKKHKELLDWGKNQKEDTFIKINNNYKTCDFQVNWIKN